MKTEEAVYSDRKYYYFGSPVSDKRKRVIFYFSGKIEKRYERNIIKSALEASMHGYDILTNGCFRARRALNLPVLYVGGRMDVVVHPSLECLRIDDCERYVLLSAGSFISFTDSSTYSSLSLKESALRMLDFSDKMIFIGKVHPYLASEALDRGMDVAVMRDFLYEKSVRRLASEGAAVIDTFSSWLSYPEYMAYEEYKEDGCYLRMMDLGGYDNI